MIDRVNIMIDVLKDWVDSARLKLLTVGHKCTRSWWYLKFVWTTGDFDWDYGFLERLVYQKLVWMRDYHSRHELIDSHERVTKQLSYAIWLMDECDRIDKLKVSSVVEFVACGRRQQELTDRWWKHVQKYYRGWWE